MTDEEIPTAPVVDPEKPPEETEPEQSPTSLIDKANEAAERLEASNKELARLLKIQQDSIIKNKLSGQATAGTPKLTKEEKDIENAKKALEGTGMEDYVFPPKKQ